MNNLIEHLLDNLDDREYSADFIYDGKLYVTQKPHAIRDSMPILVVSVEEMV